MQKGRKPLEKKWKSKEANPEPKKKYPGKRPETVWGVGW